METMVQLANVLSILLHPALIVADTEKVLAEKKWLLDKWKRCENRGLGNPVG